MKYLEFREALQDFTIFSIDEIKKIDSRYHRRRLNNWQDKGYIKKVIKGHYISSDLVINEDILFEIANKIHFLDKFSQKKLSKRIHLFWNYLKNA
ncbi:MAG: hypothetical protein PVH37_13780 [Desulfobacterales bacterium]|jgi:predicted transcriptional regulator of viral defense system